MGSYPPVTILASRQIRYGGAAGGGAVGGPGEPERQRGPLRSATTHKGCTMNKAQAVRATVTAEGVRLRLWIDDEAARHLAVAELEIPRSSLMMWLTDIEVEQEYADQQQLTFD